MLELIGPCKRFGGVTAANEVTLTVPAGSITALIGPNGVGKTTTFALITGFHAPDAGEVRFDGERIDGLAPEAIARRGLVRTFQIVQPFAGQTVRENIAVGAHLHRRSRRAALDKAEAVAREVGLGSALVPRFPGVTSALGCTVADVRQDRVRTVNASLDTLDAAALGEAMHAAADTLKREIRDTGVALERVERMLSLDMLYVRQTHPVAVPLELRANDRAAADAAEPLTRAQVREAFDAAYRVAYGRLLEGIPVRVVNHRVAVIGRRPALDMGVFAPDGPADAEACRIGTRVVFADGRSVEAGVYERLALGVGAVVAGPAVLEQPDTTVFVDPGLVARVDAFGNLVIRAANVSP